MAQKSDAAYKTISEVSDMLSVPAHVLRFWEGKFSQLKPMKRSGGRRYYRQDDIALLGLIKTLLYDEGYTIKGAQASLSRRRRADSGQEPQQAAPLPPETPAAISAPRLAEAAGLLAQAQARLDRLIAQL